MSGFNLDNGLDAGKELKTCYSDACNNLVTRDDATLYAFGVTHYSKTKGQSYLQIHDSIHACSDECGVMAAHQRIEATKQFEHGVMHGNLNPTDEFTSAFVETNVTYTPMIGSWNGLPKVCALASCGKSLSEDVYVPHVDAKGNCYQAILQANDNGVKGGLDAYSLGACCVDHAYELAHLIVDFVHADVKKDRASNYNQPTVQVPAIRSRKA